MKKGFAAIFIVIIVFVIIFTLFSVFLFRQKLGFLNNLHNSFQAYYLAESGIEDALLRIKNNPSLSDFSYAFETEKGIVEVDISENIGGVLNIISKGEFLDTTQRIRVRYQIDSENISFHYGAQAGEGGISMGNNSIIEGNVFSNGDIIAKTGSVDVTDSVIAKTIDNINIGQDAMAYNCLNAEIIGNLFFVDQQSCQVEGNIEQIEGIEPKDFPISEEIIERWVKEAKAGEVIDRDYLVEGIESFGPAHIKGDLELSNNSTLRMEGTVLVSGDLLVRNNSVLELDQDYYQDLSGVIIVEGESQIRPGGILRGSGQQSSYLMLLSLNKSLEKAIQIDNTSDGGIFYAPYGTILLKQRIIAREVTAYKIILEQNAEISYEIGLENLFFSSGAGGGWSVLSWEKIK